MQFSLFALFGARNLRNVEQAGKSNVLFTEIKLGGPDQTKWDGWLFLFAINSVPFYLYFTTWNASKETQTRT